MQKCCLGDLDLNRQQKEGASPFSFLQAVRSLESLPGAADKPGMWLVGSQPQHHRAAYGRAALELRDSSLITSMWRESEKQTLATELLGLFVTQHSLVHPDYPVA